MTGLRSFNDMQYEQESCKSAADGIVETQGVHNTENYSNRVWSEQ